MKCVKCGRGFSQAANWVKPHLFVVFAEFHGVCFGVLARVLGLGEPTVRYMTYRHELPCVMVGPRGVRRDVSGQTGER